MCIFTAHAVKKTVCFLTAKMNLWTVYIWVYVFVFTSGFRCTTEERHASFLHLCSWSDCGPKNSWVLYRTLRMFNNLAMLEEYEGIYTFAFNIIWRENENLLMINRLKKTAPALPYYQRTMLNVIACKKSNAYAFQNFSVFSSVLIAVNIKICT